MHTWWALSKKISYHVINCVVKVTTLVAYKFRDIVQVVLHFLEVAGVKDLTLLIPK